MISERELWACADQVLRGHGDAAATFLAERVADLARKGDEAGVATWRAIAARVDRLREASAEGRIRH